MNEKSKNGDQEPAAQVVPDTSLETVRDILFGAQVRESKQRTAELEAMLKATADKLQKEFDKQLRALHDTVHKLQVSLAKQADSTAADVANRFQHIDATLAKLEQSTKSNQHDLYEELTAEREALEKRAAEWNEDLARQLDDVHQQLLHAKTDRSTLAALLQNMATSLLDDADKQGAKQA